MVIAAAVTAWPSRGTIRYRPVQMCLMWDPASPLAVHATVGPEHVTWALGRDLLRDGLAGAAGCGDVRVRPGAAGLTRLRLCPPGGTVVLAVPTDQLRDFLDATYRAVPADTEYWGGLGVPSTVAELEALCGLAAGGEA